jgi:hypothetical protein
MEGGDCLDAIARGGRGYETRSAAHAITLRAHLPILATDDCWSSHPMNALASVICVVSVRAARQQLRDRVAEPASAVGAFDAVERFTTSTE